MLQYTTYPIAPKGLATSFTETELPEEYATQFTNRFINAAGGAEVRQGILAYDATVPGGPNLTGLHEMLIGDNSILFASAAGKIYKLSSDETAWTTVYSDGDTTAIYKSFQMGKKFIFVNGVDRNIYTEDGETFHELEGIIEKGTLDSGTSQTGIAEADVTNWKTETLVQVNDIVYNATKKAYGIITVVATASVTHTNISTSAVGIGLATASQVAGDVYKIIDLVELNVIPNAIENDNVATCGNNSSSSIIVTAVPDWTKTEIRKGDFIRNTTKGWVTQVTAIATGALAIVRATASAGDSLIFMKAAMPIANRAHVHYGRSYMVDSRDDKRGVISGPNDPTDMTTDAGTLDSASLSFGTYQPTADRLVAFATFQRFLAICGLRNVFLFEGTTPIVDVTTKSVDFSPVGMFPQGVLNGDSVLTLGNDLAYISVDGIQAISLQSDASTLGRENLSEALRTTLRDEIAAANPNDIRLFHYPKRSWLCVKIGSKIYVYNYTPYFGAAVPQNAQFPSNKGSWSLFDGLFAQQNVYIVLSDGTLVCAGGSGKVYKFDQGTYTDDGTKYATKYRTGWLPMTAGNKRTPQNKQLHYIRPVINVGAPINYTISVESPFDAESADTRTITITPSQNTIGQAVIGQAKIGGSSVVDNKLSMRCRGKEVRITFTTEGGIGPDVLSRFTVFYTMHGVR